MSWTLALVNSMLAADTYHITWDATDDTGQKVPSGIYYYQLQIGNEVTETKKMVLLR